MPVTSVTGIQMHHRIVSSHEEIEMYEYGDYFVLLPDRIIGGFTRDGAHAYAKAILGLEPGDYRVVGDVYAQRYCIDIQFDLVDRALRPVIAA